MRPEVVSWDVDGTLYSMPRMTRALVWLGMKGLVSRRVTQNIRELRALSRLRRDMREVRRAGGALGHAGMPSDRARLLDYEQRWYGQAIARVGPRDGVVWAIAKLAEAGVRQIVVSDYVSHYKLARLGLDGAFEGVYAGEEMGYLKPASALFRAVADDLGVPPSQILHIGDREDTDGVAARGAGCGVAIIGSDVRDVRELASPDHLGRLLAPRNAVTPGLDD